MRENPEGGKLDPAEGVYRHRKKNSPSVLSCIGKRTREGCDHGSTAMLKTIFELIYALCKILWENSSCSTCANAPAPAGPYSVSPF